MPTVYGEKVVIRLLDRNNKVLTIEELGMTPSKVHRFQKIMSVPNGIILVTGPTGSGKTTTLYATLMALNTIKKNIITVEDPVEYRLNGINQTQVNVKAGLDFANCLRSILRQDPDIIMIGEIRDADTAQIAVRAAITGHLVLSTLHTNDTASAVARLINMGIEPYLLSSSLAGVVAQRLVKKICTNCKVAYEITEREAKRFGIHRINIYKGEGCNLCNHTGYRGRTAIYEILLVTHQMKDAIDNRLSTESLKSLAMNEGMTTLYTSCYDLMVNGITTIEELNKMTNSIDEGDNYG
jgi:type IV pilus assembly protein PilB